MQFFERQHEARAQTLKLLLLFALTLVLLVLAVNAALALTWRVLTPDFLNYPAYFFTVNTSLTLLFVLGGWWLETSAHTTGEALARRAGAREAWPSVREPEQRLCNIISELAIAASMKAPAAMVLPRHQGINAFAAGWDEDDAVVAVTQGALDCLTRDELQGLLAHEFSHLHEGDTRLNMRLAGMVGGLEMIFNLGRSMCEPNSDGHRTVLALPGLAIVVTGSLGWLAGRALKAAVSRQREYLADARAVQFTRSRDGLGGVLRKIAGEEGGWLHPGDAPGPAMDTAVSHMLLVSGGPSSRWFATHPPLSERIRRIYGRPMSSINARPADMAPTRPDMLG